MEDRLLQFARKSTGCTSASAESTALMPYGKKTYTAEGSTTEPATSIG